MNLVKTAGIIVVFVLCLAVAGCYEDKKVKWHEPGQYIGQQDPLLKTSGTPELQDRLAQRLENVQTDR